MSRAEDIFEKLVYFGEDAIDEFLENRQTEELFLDFKQAASDGKSMRTLHPNDRRNLSKAISAFGNSEGGVLVWGVECSRDLEIGDVAKAKVKVKNVYRFLSWLENAISGCTIPSHNKVRNHIISSDKDGNGYLATYIPKSDIAPLMTTTGNQIYIRSGSNNVPAPYAVVAGMFGKRPQPNVDLVITDLQTPDVDGIRLTQFIKSNKDLDFIPVVLLTTKTDIEDRLQALRYGADDYVTKPFEPEYLRARVHNILTQREQLEKSYRQRLMRMETKNDEPIPGDAFLAKLLDVMGRQLDNNTLTVEDLVDEMNMGRTVFFNKLKSITGLSPVEFIREMRIKKAAQLLEERKYNITEVTYMVGMDDSRYFSKCFKNTYGVTPTEYRRQRFETNEQAPMSDEQ